MAESQQAKEDHPKREKVTSIRVLWKTSKGKTLPGQMWNVSRSGISRVTKIPGQMEYRFRPSRVFDNRD